MELLLSGMGGPSERTEVFLHVDLATYLGVNDSPAILAGRGPIEASVARRIISGSDTTLRRVLTDQRSGQALELSPPRSPLSLLPAVLARSRSLLARPPFSTRPALSGGWLSPGALGLPSFRLR